MAPGNEDRYAGGMPPDPSVLSEWVRRYEAHRRPRTAHMQTTARQNTWMRYPTDADWVYGYHAWEVELPS